ncbi:MAG TPA: response regulator [Thermoanaerobaculia bacterium]|jgi:two-component system response regulator
MTTILLIEDNPDDVELTMLAFQKNNIVNEVLVARDGVEALEVLHGEGSPARLARIAVVLLDLKLPRIDGLQVLRALRADARTSLMPVVVLTSSREEHDLVESYKLGVNSYIRKPVNFEAFLDAARHIGMYWLMLNERPPVELS